MLAPLDIPAALPPLGGLRAVAEAAAELATRGEPGVLAVVVETSGSTYRKAGALILLDARGVRVGALSGGCLEGELETAARSVIADGTVADLRFDTSGDEDRVFGSGTGCGGSTRVLLLPLPAAVSPLRDALIDAERGGLALHLRVELSAARCGRGEVGAGDAPSRRFDRHGATIDDEVAGDAVSLHIPAAPRLLLLGAGPETRPLLQFTRLLGWRTELVEHRQRWVRFADGCGVDCLHAEGPAALPALFANTRFDGALVMNHNYLLDARCLTALADAELGYVGLLGPASRRDDLLAEIGETCASRQRPNLHAPVGLRLGGEGAEAIALAIVAELQEHFARAAKARRSNAGAHDAVLVR